MRTAPQHPALAPSASKQMHALAHTTYKEGQGGRGEREGSVPGSPHRSICEDLTAREQEEAPSRSIRTLKQNSTRQNGSNVSLQRHQDRPTGGEQAQDNRDWKVNHFVGGSSLGSEEDCLVQIPAPPLTYHMSLDDKLDFLHVPVSYTE